MKDAPMLIMRNCAAKLLHASTSGQLPPPRSECGDDMAARLADKTLYPPAPSMTPMQHTSTRKCRNGHHHRVLLGHVIELAMGRELQRPSRLASTASTAALPLLPGALAPLKPHSMQARGQLAPATGAAAPAAPHGQLELGRGYTLQRS